MKATSLQYKLKPNKTQKDAKTYYRSHLTRIQSTSPGLCDGWAAPPGPGSIFQGELEFTAASPRGLCVKNLHSQSKRSDLRVGCNVIG